MLSRTAQGAFFCHTDKNVVAKQEKYPKAGYKWTKYEAIYPRDVVCPLNDMLWFWHMQRHTHGAKTRNHLRKSVNRFFMPLVGCYICKNLLVVTYAKTIKGHQEDVPNPSPQI